jgi:hypothetical protein
MKGGAGATSHGLSTYGGINDQQRAGPNDNTIAIKQMRGGKGAVFSPALFSNNNKSKKSKGGRFSFYRGPSPTVKKRRGGSRKNRGTRKARGGAGEKTFLYLFKKFNKK